MKKVIFGLFLSFVIPFSAMSQDNEAAASNEFSPWQFRLRGVVVTPDESATIDVIGGDAEISTTVIPELDITYFFTENIAAELILGTTKHDVTAIDTAVGDIDLGSIWLLPPTLTAQYHFTGGNLKPYVGAGINYTIFWGADEGPVADEVSYDNNIGFALQGGLDYSFNDHWFINADVKKLFLSTDATVDATTALGATVGAEVDINPWLIGLGVGYRL
ncbi:OmpW/AlkL family protein [Luteirhabdus pelagi]|uniref:OmpW/AlkL family protein n=1 Tax=Luteirhabdus pelagi TaxID=2792783 RepID=UPI00193AB4E6|nr:OmpW family outer membrane protein [Luteirhabdus pelagi]